MWKVSANSSGVCHPRFSQQIFQGRIVEHGIGPQKPLQACVVILQALQTLCLGHVHATEFGLPFLDRGIARTMVAAQIRDRDPGLVFLQNPDDLLIREAAAFHVLVLSG